MPAILGEFFKTSSAATSPLPSWRSTSFMVTTAFSTWASWERTCDCWSAEKNFAIGERQPPFSANACRTLPLEPAITSAVRGRPSPAPS